MSEGEKIIIAGPNGSGKTTLLKCILGLIGSYSGEIKISESANIAYCKQDFSDSRFPISAREIVEMGLYGSDRDRSTVDRAMRITNTTHLADRSFYTLSGGERQRVNLARCFCQNANLLLLDEPSSFLDKDSRTDFISMMRGLPEDVSAIVVTHDSELFDGLGWNIVRIAEEN